jgi:hypothetical protein
MLTDQRVLDHLLYVYRMKDRLARSEWSGSPGTVSPVIDWPVTS